MLVRVYRRDVQAGLIVTLVAAAVALCVYLIYNLRVLKKAKRGEFARLKAGVRVNMVFGLALNLCLAMMTLSGALDDYKEHLQAVNTSCIRAEEDFVFWVAALAQPVIYLLLAAACGSALLMRRHLYISSEGVYDGGVFVGSDELEYLNDERLLTIQKKGRRRGRFWIFEHSKEDLRAAVEICEKYYSKAQTTSEFLDSFFDSQ